jgi:hypothetical protein
MDILAQVGYHGQVVDRSVFFADVLGFGALSLVPGAGAAQDTLTALSNLLSQDDALGALLNWPGWEERYALSDSIFLVSGNPLGSAAAAAEIFFNLAYVSHSGENPVLMRGAVARGEAFRVEPIFRDSATFNLVGEAVVRAVRLEGSPLKGPRLFVDEGVAKALEDSESPVKWLLDRRSQQAELLWLLSPDPSQANGLLIGELCGKIISLVQRHGGTAGSGPHYLGYLDLLIRSLDRLSEVRADQSATALKICRLHEKSGDLEALLMSPEMLLIEKIRRLAR